MLGCGVDVESSGALLAFEGSPIFGKKAVVLVLEHAVQVEVVIGILESEAGQASCTRAEVFKSGAVLCEDLNASVLHPQKSGIALGTNSVVSVFGAVLNEKGLIKGNALVLLQEVTICALNTHVHSKVSGALGNSAWEGHTISSISANEETGDALTAFVILGQIG